MQDRDTNVDARFNRASVMKDHRMSLTLTAYRMKSCFWDVEHVLVSFGDLQRTHHTYIPCDAERAKFDIVDEHACGLSSASAGQVDKVEG
jgi:hypothetical protein